MKYQKYNTYDLSEFDFETLLSQCNGSINSLAKSLDMPYALVSNQCKPFRHKFFKYLSIDKIPTDSINYAIDEYISGSSARESRMIHGISEDQFKTLKSQGKIDLRLRELNLENYKIEFESYTRKVRKLTLRVKKLFDIIPPLGFHVNHKFSVYDGFKYNIPPEYVANHKNLEIIPDIENRKQNKKSKITKEELIELICNF